MFGDYESKFKQMRAALLLIMTYPGKKMLFMGTEYGQFREWDYENSLEWFMLNYDNHRSMREYVAALNRFYLKNSELWDIDFDSDGFTWLLPSENDKNSVAYLRHSKKGDKLLILINFSGISQNILLKDLKGKFIECVFESENTVLTEEPIKIIESSANIVLPRFYGGIFKIKSYKRKIKV